MPIERAEVETKGAEAVEVSKVQEIREEDILQAAALTPVPAEFRILVVDDEVINQQVLANQLSLQHY